MLSDICIVGKIVMTDKRNGKSSTKNKWAVVEAIPSDDVLEELVLNGNLWPFLKSVTD